MTRINILVADGNERSDREKLATYNGLAPSGLVERLLTSMDSEINVEIICPSDAESSSTLPLEDYDGILTTGSRLNAYDHRPEVLRQIEFAKSAFQSGTPMFGICWGLQVAVVAAGGEVAASTSEACRCEVPIAHGIILTQPGLRHPMHGQRPSTFDALAFHTDHIVTLPKNATVTARNEHFIQGLEIVSGKSVFWGVQYHPEATTQDMAGYMKSCVPALVASARYSSPESVQEVARLLVNASGRANNSQAGETNDFSAAGVFAPIEIENWLEHQVRPYARRNKGETSANARGS